MAPKLPTMRGTMIKVERESVSTTLLACPLEMGILPRIGVSKEKDLLFFKDNVEPVMKGYSVFSRDTVIDQDVLEFYGHMWNLGEIAYYGSKILFEDYSDAQNQIWLDNLKGGWDFSF